jgi:hypothetical protein
LNWLSIAFPSVSVSWRSFEKPNVGNAASSDRITGCGGERERDEGLDLLVFDGSAQDFVRIIECLLGDDFLI